MRILQLHTRYREAGGEDAAVAGQSSMLREAGHEVALLEMTNPTRPVPTARAFAQAPWNVSSAAAVRETILRTRPDVVHLHNTWFAMSPSVVAAAADHAPAVVMSLHNYRLICANSNLLREGRPCEDCVGSHPWHAVRHACYHGSRPRSAVAAATIALHTRRKTFADGVDLFLATTPFARSRFEAAGLPRDRLLVAPHPVPDPGPRAAPPSASRDLLVVGRLSPEKGVHLVVEALSAGVAPSLRLVVVGDGPERRRLEALAGPRVTFLGTVEPAEVRRLMLSARALLFPSLGYETFGLSLVEAMAAGLPVLASDLGGSPWIVGEQAGRMVPPGHVEAWRRELHALSDDDVVDQMGAAGRARWREHYRPERAVRLLEHAYECAASHRRARCPS